MKSSLLNKERQRAKTWSVENLFVENAPFQVDLHGKREIIRSLGVICSS